MDKQEMVETALKCVEEGICLAGEIMDLILSCIFAGDENACEEVEKLEDKDTYIR